VDHVLPAVGYRQWVLSFPGPMAVRLGYDAPLLAAIAGRLARAVMQDMRRSVKQQHGLASVATLHAGVVTVVQRFRSDLGLYVHLHCLVTDGAYEEQGDGVQRFLAALPPTPERMTAVLAQVHEVVRAADDDLDLDPALAACVQLSLAGPHPAPGSQPAEVSARPPRRPGTWDAIRAGCRTCTGSGAGRRGRAGADGTVPIDRRRQGLGEHVLLLAACCAHGAGQSGRPGREDAHGWPAWPRSSAACGVLYRHHVRSPASRTHAQARKQPRIAAAGVASRDRPLERGADEHGITGAPGGVVPRAADSANSRLPRGRHQFDAGC